MIHQGYESLHNHTTASDGSQTHEELLATAEKYQFGIIAFTDHDMLPSEKKMQELAAYKGPVQWHIGCEISSGWPSEIGGGAASMFHIVGLFTDPRDQALREHCRLAAEARIERMREIVTNLRNIGLTISVDDCLAASGGESVGRPHIVKALLGHEQNRIVIDDIRQKMRRAAEHDSAIQEKYARMMEQEPEKHAYTLFLSDDSFVPGVYVDYQYWTDMDKSVSLIRGAGGIAILAHWPTIKKKVPLATIGEYIQQGRLDGIEVASGFLGADAADDEQNMQQLADTLGCIQTIGIDAHRETDFASFVADKPAAAQASIGQTARILQKLKEK